MKKLVRMFIAMKEPNFTESMSGKDYAENYVSNMTSRRCHIMDIENKDKM